MRLRYETGIATLTQFVIMTVLNLVNAINSSVTGCWGAGGECLNSTLISLMYFLLVAGWFGVIAVIGYAAQDRRSKRMAQILIAAEGAVLLISLFNAQHYPDILGLITSLADALLAVWIIILAYRLMRAKGGRVVSRARSRRRSNSSHA